MLYENGFIKLTRSDGQPVLVRSEAILAMSCTQFPKPDQWTGSKKDIPESREVVVLNVGGTAYYVMESVETILSLMIPREKLHLDEWREIHGLPAVGT